MKKTGRRKILNKLLLRTRGDRRLWPSLLALCTGAVLLLTAVIIATGYRDVLAGKYGRDNKGSTYLVINKEIPADEKITEQKIPVFDNTEIRALGSLPVVKDIGMFTSALFPVEVSFEGDSMRFSTNLFLETVHERFIDDKPIDWYWQAGMNEVPVIISNEFLNLYNFGYAANQGVPQLTKGTISTLEFTLTIGEGIYAEAYRARVAGFSDRISSILVPEAFIEYGNSLYAQRRDVKPSRLIVEVTDPSDEIFVQYLQESKYETNNEHLRWNRIRTVVYTTSIGIAALALILLVMSTSVFTLFTRVLLQRVEGNIHKLKLLGYSPYFLSRYLFVRYALILVAVMVAAGILTIVVQVRMAKLLVPLDLYIATFPGWEVWVALGVISLLILLALYRTVIKALK